MEYLGRGYVVLASFAFAAIAIDQLLFRAQSSAAWAAVDGVVGAAIGLWVLNLMTRRTAGERPSDPA